MLIASIGQAALPSHTLHLSYTVVEIVLSVKNSYVSEFVVPENFSLPSTLLLICHTIDLLLPCSSRTRIYLRLDSHI